MLEIPSNMKAEFEVKPGLKVSVNNEITICKTGIIYLEAGSNTIEVYN